nr:putative GH32 family protein a [Tetragonula mellipes]WEI57644.1 putative GH32 family protein a [Tetragonula mellipes]
MADLAPIQLTNERYRLDYHLQAPSGWINDPNGFCYFRGYYHMFYQYYPYGAEWGPMHWGHARSKDLINWQTLPIALTPGDEEDRSGCFSGSAIVKDDTLYLIYTGHNCYDDSDPDHYWQNQNLAYSTDGIHFTKYEHNPIIATPPTDNTQEFRDPKVWEHDGAYYVVLGSQTKEHLGRVLLYKSTDLRSWDYLGPLTQSQQAELEGYMWECPDIFRLNGHDILLTSPQGITAQKEQYLNLHQTGYFVGQLDYQTPKLTRGDFHELDAGHDFYAPQTMLAPDGRRIMMGWLAMWESEMPEQADGWAGALTIPRELVWRNNQIYMQPIQEMKQLRQKQLAKQTWNLADTPVICQGQATAEINLTLDLKQFAGQEFTIQFQDDQSTAQVELTYIRSDNKLVLRRSDRSDKRFATIAEQDTLQLQIFVDKSSLEIFINEGATVFTERYYFDGQPTVKLVGDAGQIGGTVHQLANDVVQYH